MPLRRSFAKAGTADLRMRSRQPWHDRDFMLKHVIAGTEDRN